MSLLASLNFRLRQFHNNFIDPTWVASHPAGYLGLCDDVVRELWDIPRRLKEITVELHDQPVPGSYRLSQTKRSKHRGVGYYTINRRSVYLYADVRLVLNGYIYGRTLPTKHTVWVRVLY